MTISHGFALGDWRVRPQRCIIERGDEKVHVKPKAMAVLECLARAGGEVVSRNELFDSIWPGAAVSDDALNQCVVELRKAFKDAPSNPRVIETIPKRGYRLIPGVLPAGREVVGGPAPQLSMPGEQQATNGTKRPVWSAAGTISLAALIIAVALLWHFYQGNRTDRVRIPVAEDRPSIAVLPFVDMSAEHDQGYFVDGMTEELIARLAQVEGLLVIGRTSSFYFKDKHQDLRVIGEALNVRYVIEGSARKSDDRLRVTAQLIDTSSGYHVWSISYDRDLTDMFAIQDDIAQSVAAKLGVSLGIAGQTPLAAAGTSNMEAYDWYLRARRKDLEFWATFDLSARDDYERAIELDPQFAKAHGYLALSLARRIPTDAATRRAYQAALMINPNEPSAKIAMAISELWQTWDWCRLGERLRVVMASDAILGSYEYALYFLFPLRRYEEALRVLNQKLALDPLNSQLRLRRWQILIAAGQTDESIADAQAYLKSNPTTRTAWFNLFTALTRQERFAEAERALNQYVELTGEKNPIYVYGRGSLAMQRGDEPTAADSKKQLKSMAETPDMRAMALFMLGWLHADLGETEAAIANFEKARVLRWSRVIYTRAIMGGYALYQDLIQHNDFQDFLAKMNLDDASTTALSDCS